MFLVLCHATRFPSAVLGRVDSFSSEAILLLYMVLFRTFLIRLGVDDLGTVSCRSTRHSRSPPGKISANSLLLPRLVLGSGFRSNGDTSETYTAFLPLFASKLAGTSLPDFFNLHASRSQYETAMMRIFSQSFCEETSIYPDSCLIDFGARCAPTASCTRPDFLTTYVTRQNIASYNVPPMKDDALWHRGQSKDNDGLQVCGKTGASRWVPPALSAESSICSRATRKPRATCLPRGKILPLPA